MKLQINIKQKLRDFHTKLRKTKTIMYISYTKAWRTTQNPLVQNINLILIPASLQNLDNVKDVIQENFLKLVHE